MEWVDHVHIVEIGSSCLVSDVHRMLQWEIPYRECLELSIACTHTTLVLVIKLAQANSHLTATRTRSSNNHQRTLSLYIIILAKTLIRSNEIYIVRITLDEIMAVSLDTLTLQALLEGDGCRLTIKMSNNNRTHHKTTVLEFTTQAKHILIVSDTQIGTLLVLLNIGSTDHDNNLDAIANLLKHAQLTIRLETWQNAAGVMVIEKLTSQFEIKLSIKL